MFSTPFQLNYTNFDIDQDRVLVYNNTTLQLYDMSGTLKYSGNIDTSISRARVARGVKNPLGLDLLIGSAGAMESVKLK